LTVLFKPTSERFKLFHSEWDRP